MEILAKTGNRLLLLHIRIAMQTPSGTVREDNFHGTLFNSCIMKSFLAAAFAWKKKDGQAGNCSEGTTLESSQKCNSASLDCCP
jgi:hypothetical protein